MQSENPRMTEEQAEAQAGLDCRWLLGDPRGARIARMLLRWSSVDDTGPTQGEAAMAFAAGSRMVGNLLRAHLRKHDEQGWVRLETEYVRELNEEARRAAEREKQARADDVLRRIMERGPNAQ